MKNNAFGGKSKKISVYIVSGFVTVLCIALGVFAFVKLGNISPVNTNAKNDNESIAANLDVQIPLEDNEEVRGVWIATTININFPSKQGLSVRELKNELDDILKTSYQTGLNTVFFQVRPCADALYNSDIFPSSVYLTGKQGEKPEDDFDCLEYLLNEAKKYDIDVHAWINPYRVTMYESDNEKLSSDNPAVLYPEYTVKYADGKTYFNPALQEVRDLVVSGVKELVTNYPDLAGIHFDDYFYPYPSGNAEFDDAAQYEILANGQDKAQWRRENVNALVKQTYEAIKEINPECLFGVSPFGIWANKGSDTYVAGSDTNGLEAYSSLYCDALAWVNGGYVDYIAPQNYWSFSAASSAFDNVARWWNANLDGTGVDLYMGHAAYKAKDYAKNELASQVEFCRSLISYKGSIFYGYEDIKNNTVNIKTKLSQLYSYPVVYSDNEPSGKGVNVKFPSNNSNAPSQYTYIIGSSDPAYPVMFEGEKLSRTKDGYFNAYKKLSVGKNTLSFTQNGKTKNITVNYKNTKNSPSAYKTMGKFELQNMYPNGETWITTGEKLTVSCAAPAGSVVTAKIGGMEIVLSPTINPPFESEYMYELYKGTFSPSTFVNDTEITSLGTLTFTASLNGETTTKQACLIKQAGKNAYAYATVVNDYSHTKVTTSSSFYDDFLPSSAGMRDYVRFKTDGYYKLRFGGFVSEENVQITYGEPLQLNKIITTAIEVVCTDSTNNKNNTTDLRFGVTENVPVDVDFRENSMRIIIYNTDVNVLPQFEIKDNPLISSIEGTKGTRENMVIYRVKLKDDNNFYGFNIVYENGMMIVKLNNPQSLASGDKPLLNKTIVVDAGHGGTDKGALGHGDKNEADLNFEIANVFAEKLTELGANVVRTRESDITIDLYERMDLFNKINPDMLVSVHHNSVTESSNAGKARGFLSLYSNNSGVLLAKTLSETVSDELCRLERQCSYQQLAVCRNHRFPSALVEMSFICNAEEYQWTLDKQNIERSADALVNATLEYYKIQEAYLDY